MKTYQLMLILFDQGTPWPLRRYLTGHTIHSAYWLGWDELTDGELLERAEEEGFELLITTDQDIRYQQNTVGRKIAIIVLMLNEWKLIRPHVDDIVNAVNRIKSGDYVEIEIPFASRQRDRDG